MDLDPEVRRTRARQVGMLMQTYRRAHDVKGRRLSQEGLLRLMGEADPRYLERYERSTVARWESGEIRPTRERIEVFGEALHLSPIEVEGLISLAGLDLENGNGQDIGPRGSEEKAQAGDALLGDAPPPDPVGAAGGDAASYAGEAIRFSLSRFLLPGSCVAGAGYALASLGWGTTWMLMLYVSVAIGLVLVQGFLRLRRSNELRELFFLSVFFLLCTPMVQAPLTRMDNYGFYAIGDFAGTPMPYLLALIVNLLLALVAGLMFDFLWKWQYFGGRSERNAYRRAAWVVLPPLAFVYVNLLVFSNVGAWIYLSAVFSVLAGVFITLAALRDEDVSLPDWNRKLLLGGAVAATIVLVAFNGAAILAVYLQPGPACPAGSQSAAFLGHRLRRLGISSGGTGATAGPGIRLGLAVHPSLHGHLGRGTPHCDHLPAGRWRFGRLRGIRGAVGGRALPTTTAATGTVAAGGGERGLTAAWVRRRCGLFRTCGGRGGPPDPEWSVFRRCWLHVVESPQLGVADIVPVPHRLQQAAGFSGRHQSVVAVVHHQQPGPDVSDVGRG